MARGGKEGAKTVLLNLGVALAVSFSGFLYSRLRTKWFKPPRACSPDGDDHRCDPERSARLKIDLDALNNICSGCNSVSKAHEELGSPKATDDSSSMSLSPNSVQEKENSGFLLPEFDELMKEFEVDPVHAGVSPDKDVHSCSSDVETAKVYKTSAMDNLEKEIYHLRNVVQILRERENGLEAQLFEYYGLKEQESAAMELHNRIKINNVEAHLFSLKIESLQAENRRLKAQLVDHAHVVAELETAREKIKSIENRLRTDAMQNKEQILILQQRVSKLQDQEHNVSGIDPEMQLQLQKLKNLDIEREELRKLNASLRVENLDLLQRLESTQILATSVLEDSEAKEIKEMCGRLKEENEGLSKEIERLRAGHCADVEELVYLRWLNACLRYELRNYHPPPGKTAARDLSNSLSPESEEKAKQLILEYASAEVGERGVDIPDFDFDQWSSSQASCLTDSTEHDETDRTSSSGKMKFFTKLRRLVHRKASHNDNLASSEDRIAYPEELWEAHSCTSLQPSPSTQDADGHSNRFTSSSHATSGSYLGISRPRKLSLGDVKDMERSRPKSLGSLSSKKAFVLGQDGGTSSQHHDKKSELAKYAEVLKIGRAHV